MGRVPSPIDVFPWDLSVVNLADASSVIQSTRLLDSVPRPNAVYEIHSVRATLSEDGTGDLASAAIGTGPEIPAGLANNDGALMGVRSTARIGGALTPTVVWHWGRSNQAGAGSGDGSIYLPPEFYWDGEMQGFLQNGAGATVDVLFTVAFRIVVFSEKDFLALLARILPGTIQKNTIFVA